jgi:DNA-directed RNA polymerase subunit E'/Rpb7
MSAGISLSADKKIIDNEKINDTENNGKITLKIKKSKLGIINKKISNNSSTLKSKDNYKTKKSLNLVSSPSSLVKSPENNPILIPPKIDISILENNDIVNLDSNKEYTKSELIYNKFSNIYSKKIINKRITIHISKINCNLKKLLERVISEQFDAKCNVEGFIKPRSINLLTYSSGIISSCYVIFDVSFECLVCSPIDGDKIDVLIKNVTKAGIRAEIDDTPTPMVIFISRNTNPKYNLLFDNFRENDTIKVKIIGKRFELNDKFISVIADLVH